VTGATGAHSIDHADTSSYASNTIAKISVTIDNVRKWTADDVKQWIDKNGLEK
jgi:hypothetical protein